MDVYLVTLKFACFFTSLVLKIEDDFHYTLKTYCKSAKGAGYKILVTLSQNNFEYSMEFKGRN